MVYKNFTGIVLIRVVLLVVLSGSAAYSLMHSQWTYLALCVVLTAFVVYGLMASYHSVNRKLSFFFDSIRNDDNTLHFPENVSSDSARRLHKSLNKVNHLISDIKVKSERRERFFREFLKYSATGMVVVDEKGYVEIINDAALKLCNTGILVHIDRLKQSNNGLHEAMLNLEPNRSKITKVMVNGESHQISIRLAKLKFYDHEFRVFSLGDIKSELDEKEIETTQKLIKILTHEIMNSIAPISSISDTLLNYFKNGNAVSDREMKNISHGLEVINERSKGLTHFVNTYRKLTKIPKPDFKEIKLNDWLESIKLLAKERAERELIKLSVQNNYKGDSFLGDKKLLTQVVINLLNNAADALQKQSEKKITVEVSGKEGDYISIKFIDNGPGISPENLEQIFIPFFTTRENGSGIGLSLSRQILNLHKGRLTARSAEGRETVFEMRV